MLTVLMGYVQMGQDLGAAVRGISSVFSHIFAPALRNCDGLSGDEAR